MPLLKQKRGLLLFIIGGCIVIVLLWFNGQYIANKFGWGWQNNFPDHLHYQGRDYSLGISECQTSTNIKQLFPSITQIGTMPMVLGSSYPQLAPTNQVKSHGTVI